MKNLLLRAIPLVVMFACAPAGAAEPAAAPSAGFEQELRDAALLPAGTRLIYRDESGAAMTPEQFALRLQEGAPFNVTRDEAAGTAILTLKPKPSPQSEIGPVTQLAPLDLRDLYGRRIRNPDLAGRPTLISFFFETCVPCIKEAPVLNAYRLRHQELNYLAVTPDDAQTAKRFVVERKFDWPVAYDGKPFIDAMKVTAYPTYLLVAADGRILGRGSGMDERDMKDPARALGEFEKWVSSRLTRRD